MSEQLKPCPFCGGEGKLEYMEQENVTMKEFIEKLIGRLEEELIPLNQEITKYFYELKDTDNPKYIYSVGRSNALTDFKYTINQLAEEYKQCIKSSCSNCETYDKEKHYCPKWCDVIKGTVAEIEESHNNDFCEWMEISVGGITAVKEPHGMKLFNHDHKQQYCPYCGKKIKVVE